MMKPLWTCPACGERFVSPRLWHSCGRHTYDALFARSEPRFSKVLTGLSRHYVACYLPLDRESDVDADVRRWMKQAYRIGRQDHLRRRSPDR